LILTGDVGILIFKNKLITKIATQSKILSNIKLFQNYPNPFNPITKITYNIARESHVSLKIYDILGKEIKVLVNEQQEPGNHSIILNASALPSGVYFYRIEAKDNTGKKYILTKKMEVLK
jgi:Secretion system C-terminal sorting domain